MPHSLLRGSLFGFLFMRKIIYLLCTLFLLGCIDYTPEIEPNQFDREFFRLTIDERIKQFQEYDSETQYKLLIIGNQLVHPPALYLVDEFAKKGKSIVPFLRSKLAAAKLEVTVRDIVAVFSAMQRFGSYEVKDDASLMALIKERIAAMQGQWKPVTQHMFEEIQPGRLGERSGTHRSSNKMMDN